MFPLFISLPISVHKLYACFQCQLLLEGKCTIKRQLYIRPFSLREAALLVLMIRTPCNAYSLHTASPNTDRLLPTGSEATPHENDISIHTYCAPSVFLLVTVGFSSPKEALDPQEQHAQRNQGPEN